MTLKKWRSMWNNSYLSVVPVPDACVSSLFWTVSEVRRDRPSHPAWRHQEEWAGAGGHRLQSCGSGTLISAECHETLFTRSCSSEDESLWLCWSSYFSSRATMRFTFELLSEISWQLSDGLLWNLLQTFMIPRGSILMTFPDFFSSATSKSKFSLILLAYNRPGFKIIKL